MRISLKPQYISTALHNQYHACWRTVNFRIQYSNRHGNDPKAWLFSSTRRVNTCSVLKISEFWFLFKIPSIINTIWIKINRQRSILNSGDGKFKFRWKKFMISSNAGIVSWQIRDCQYNGLPFKGANRIKLLAYFRWLHNSVTHSIT